MAGGLMQLLTNGAADEYIMGALPNPDLPPAPNMSYYKQTYRKHTPFAMESVRQTFLTKPVLQPNTRASYTCRIGRIADLLKEVHLSFVLPDIYSDGNLRFQWIPQVAHYMIYSYSVRLDTQLLDEGYGEWLDVWNELTLPSSKRELYNRMIGNEESFTSPKDLRPKVIVTNNYLSYSYYPARDPAEAGATPSIQGRRFYVPLPFWFTRNPALALPLVALQYQNLDVTIEFRSVEELYQLWDTETETYYSPGKLRQIRPDILAAQTQIKSFVRDGVVTGGQLDLDAHLECNFVFLGDDERKRVAYFSSDLLVERIFRIEREGVRGPTTIDLTLSMPVKELVWITRRTDFTNHNDLSQLTDEGRAILKTAKLLWNGMDRFEEKEAAYFNLLEVHKNHSNTAREGIYVYSFSLYPEKMTPSGSFNASMINKIQLYVTVNNRTADTYEYEVVTYAVYHNIFRVMGGQGAMVYAT